ncbi:MAG: restriction endonuclease subunit S [Pseudomonadota bacterium]
MTELPATWANAKFSDFGTWIGGGTPSKANPRFWNGPIPWVSPKDMKTKVIRKAIDGITEEAVENSAAKLVPAGSVLIVTRSGILAHTLPIAVTAVESTLNQDLKALALPDGISSEFIAWGMRAFEQRILDKCRKGGTTVHSIEMPRLASFELPIAPTNEQSRIVEKIESTFDEIDKGVENLQTARTTLDLYRQSLLKSAFEGRLTTDWRAQNVDKLETPETLLARIQSERDAHYKSALDASQNDLSKWRAGGEKGKKPAKPKRPKTETNQPLFEVISVSDLPSTWAAPKLVEVIDIVSGATPKGVENCTGSDVPFFKVSDMNTPGNERTMISAQVNASYEEAASLGMPICPIGTLVFPKRGGAILTNKKRRLGQPSSFDLNTMGFVNRTETIRDDFLWFWMLSVSLSDIYDGSNVPQINNKNVEPLSFPICPPAEQAEIIRLLDAKLEAADVLRAEIDDALSRADAMRQSILKKAFSGQLVTQDPKDEPASALLERIKTDRAEAPKVKKRKTANA